VQTHLIELVAQSTDRDLLLHKDHPMIPGPHRHHSTDLAILTPDRQLLLAAEFKYEPCHRRLDVLNRSCR